MSNKGAWERVQIARKMNRPTAAYYIEKLFTSFLELHGDRNYADDSAIIGGIAMFEGKPVTVIAEEKGKDLSEKQKRNFGMPNPEGYRKALRLMKQAEKFNRPIICFIDTSGAYCGVGAEERGQGEAIATNLMEMMALKVPVVSVVIGEGGSGGALAIGVANRVAMLENAVYSILSPEGFSAILWKDSTKAPQAAGVMKITAEELLSLNIIEAIIAEPEEGAHQDPKMVAEGVREYLNKTLTELTALDGETLSEQRYQRFRSL
ncbi:MAG: acetyl-CoA carboxylase carboxyltransferase subunit alpha [Clostridiales bacterium 43-6]|nr:MAG: acetyl-CoA carboxylase carboxyltransferase subunit alpha [Clostridiales bacterium 43-6]